MKKKIPPPPKKNQKKPNKQTNEFVHYFEKKLAKIEYGNTLQKIIRSIDSKILYYYYFKKMDTCIINNQH